MKTPVAQPEFLPDWKDARRRWVDVGGDIEASYDGRRYVDVRTKTGKERLGTFSQGCLEDMIKLFVPAPICK